MRALFKNQSGFSLVQGMIIAGVIAGSSLVATRMITDQKLAQKGAETRDQIDQLHAMVYSVLQNKDHCFATIKGSYTGGIDNSSIVTSPGTRQIQKIVTVGKTTTTATGTTIDATQSQTVVEINDGLTYNANKIYMNGNVIVKKIEMTYPSPSEGDGFADFAIEYERMNGSNTNLKTKSGYGAKKIRKVISLRIQRRPDTDATQYNNPFEGCYGVTENKADDAGNRDLAKTMCNELNSGESGVTTSFFEWDDTLSTCKPKEQICKLDGYVNTGINSNGMVECRKLEEWMDMNLFIDQTSAGTPCTAGKTASLVIDTTTNKVRIVCY